MNSEEKAPSKVKASERNATIMAAWIGGAATVIAVILGIVLPRLLASPPSPSSITPTTFIQSTLPSITPTTPTQPVPSSTVPATSIQLNQSYTGTTKGSANGFITFSLGSEDQQGNVSLVVTFTTSDRTRQANYSCQGKVTNDRHIILRCSEDDAQNFMLDIEGFIFQDGHMQGTMTASDSSDPNYHHNYTWNAK